MTTVSRTPHDEALFTIEQRPDETLHDCLLRAQREMAEKVRTAEAGRDAWIDMLRGEKRHWERQVRRLALGSAIGAAAACIALDEQDNAPASALLNAGLVAIAALGVGAVGLAIEPVCAWLAMTRAERQR
jgi:hypothetical protein